MYEKVRWKSKKRVLVENWYRKTEKKNQNWFDQVKKHVRRLRGERVGSTWRF